MSISLTKTGISSSSGVLNLSDGSKVIKLKNSKIIETDNYITCGSYVFKKGIDIPLAYFTQNTSSTGSYKFNIVSGEVKDKNNINVTASFPEYIENLKKVLNGKEGIFKISSVESQLNPTSSIGSTESNRFNTNHDFLVSNYSNSNRAPILRGNMEKIPNTNTFNNATISNKEITINCSTAKNSFVTLTVIL